MTGGYKDRLEAAYDADAPRRDAVEPDRWRLALVDRFADDLDRAGATRVLDLGAGTGQMGARLGLAGFDVLAVDLSAENVARCRSRGLEAIRADFTTLELEPGSFDGALAFNSLLHVPHTERTAVLSRIAGWLRPGAPFLVVVWGGEDFEGTVDPGTAPARFFSFMSDETFLALEPPGLTTLRTEILADVVGHEGRHPQTCMFVRR